MQPLVAYHNDPALKQSVLAEMAAHREADNLRQNYGYWEDGKGCAVGCLIKSGNHMEYEGRFGIPVMLARLEDRIFEGLPVEDARVWPERFLGAITPGADLSRVGWKFLHWLLVEQIQIKDYVENPEIQKCIIEARRVVALAADVIAPLAKGEEVDKAAAAKLAEDARAVRRQARAAAAAAYAAADAAYAAAYAAYAAADAAAYAAYAAADAADAAAAADAAYIKAKQQTYQAMANKLIELMAAA